MANERYYFTFLAGLKIYCILIPSCPINSIFSLSSLQQVFFHFHSLLFNFTLTMARKKLAMKRIDNPCSRKVTYSKRKESILKKANELSTKCDTDVGLLMFSPTGRLTSYASKGRVEDIFLRYIERHHDFNGAPDDEEFLCQSLKHLKFEAEMLEKIERCDDGCPLLESLERKLCELNRKKYEAQEKMRSYNPDLSKINSIGEAHLHQQFVTNSLRKIEKLKATLLEKETSPSKPTDGEVKMPTFEVKGSDSPTEESVNSNRIRNLSVDDRDVEGPLPVGPHLSISFLKAQEA